MATAATGRPSSCQPSSKASVLIQRHQRVYATLGARMQTDEVHALSMKTFTPAEWANPTPH
jgi:acid stress-induced BolA-like protein IbaG/YrbA